MTASAGADPPFAHIGIVGLGLIGGSAALAVRAAWPAVRVTGVDGPDVVQEAIRIGAIHEGRPSVAELGACDLVMLAAPVPAILQLLADAGRAGFGGVITDVGSTKRRVMAAAAAAGLRGFVGGHPIAGAEHGGLAHARADLFAGQPWMLVADEASGREAAALVERCVRGLGAEPHRIDATAHDRTVAYISHVPQLLAVALMSAAGDACGENGLRMSGRAFREMTRLASSPSDLWHGILATNADFVGEALAVLARRLPAAAALADHDAIDKTFAEAQRWRSRLPDPPARPPA